MDILRDMIPLRQMQQKGVGKMNWDPVKIKQGNQNVAKTNLKNAIKEAMNSGLYYEDLMQIIADAINEVAEESNAIAEEA